jgi:DNA-binding CsgD family transcriptional regulator
MTEDTNDNATPLAAGTFSFDYLNSLFRGYAGPGAHYAVTSQVQWLTFNSGSGLERVAAAANLTKSSPADVVDSAQRGAPDRETIGVSRRGLKKTMTSKPSSELSEREKACLSWTALGKSSWEIGQILSISENTAVFHIKNAMKKLGTNTRTGAAVKAIQLGLIASSVEDDLATRRRAYGS